MGTSSSTPASAGEVPELDASEAELLASVIGFRGDWEEVPSREWIVKMCKKDPARTRIFRSKLLELTTPEEGKVMRFAPFKQPDPGVLHATAATGFLFDLSHVRDREAVLAACALDPRVSKVKPQLVRTTQLTEEKFFKNFFTHVARIRRWLFTGLGDETGELSLTSQRSISGTVDQGEFQVAGKSFVSHADQLSGLSFTSYTELARFVGRAKPANPPRPPKVHAVNGDREAGDIDKKAVMKVLRFAAPTFLSVMLEDVAARKVSGLSDRFWTELKARILVLSTQVETFTDMELLRPDTDSQEAFESLYRFANEFQFDMARDREAVQAAWDLDPALATPFRKLIPQHLSKGRFWNRYFHKVMGITIDQLAFHM
ncbi:Hypothetical Protein FCC1311_100792 [Hondaea fermentalgiana]|uniref:BSD domain-containing protein n=1 Tax=Hondaea fermentalgiana TaxID=2315210 RepID=A0A2R5GSK3_9STRA|nr:Hypothetical Protein FCC1311_100792 [Hondaea fermentalgiana]|eukprot:GBG33856.1 Hypothetical Protein FCC1311_100792 [Hondaea fermentalgiana]